MNLISVFGKLITRYNDRNFCQLIVLTRRFNPDEPAFLANVIVSRKKVVARLRGAKVVSARYGILLSKTRLCNYAVEHESRVRATLLASEMTRIKPSGQFELAEVLAARVG